MRAARFQTTISGPCSVTGRGYWSGQLNTLTFLPAPAGTGIRFVRADLDNAASVEAVTENSQGMSLRTRITDGVSTFDMVEHVMAALYGLQIDNVEVHCTAAEMPGMDGSSLAFVLALDSVGKVVLRAKRPQLRIRERIRVGNSTQWIAIEPSNEFEVEYRLNYGSDSPIGKSTFSAIVDEDTFYHEIAPARTFVTRAEAKALQAQGIATHVTERDLIGFDDKGPANNQLRFIDECSRHNALDLVGDLAVTGVDLVGRVTANRSGHQLNAQMATQLRRLYLKNQAASKAA